MGIAHLLSLLRLRLKAKSPYIRMYIYKVFSLHPSGCTSSPLKFVRHGAQVNSLCSVCACVQYERECIFIVRNRSTTGEMLMLSFCAQPLIFILVIYFRWTVWLILLDYIRNCFFSAICHYRFVFELMRSTYLRCIVLCQTTNNIYRDKK